MDKDGVVIIGAGGIGMAITRRISTGRAVLLADCNETALKALAQQMRGEGHEVSTRVTDVADRDAVAALATAAAGLGRVTHVVHTAGVSAVQAPTERVLHVDLLGTALVLEEFGRVIAPGGAGVVISSMAGHMAGGYPSDIEHALAATPTSELLALPFLAADAVGESGASYALAKRGNTLRVQAEAVAWGARGGRINCISPGIISTPVARDEMSGPGAEGYRRMIQTSPAKRTPTTSPPRRLSCSGRRPPSSPAPTCSTTAV